MVPWRLWPMPLKIWAPPQVRWSDSIFPSIGKCPAWPSPCTRCWFEVPWYCSFVDPIRHAGPIACDVDGVRGLTCENRVNRNTRCIKLRKRTIAGQDFHQIQHIIADKRKVQRSLCGKHVPNRG